MARPREHSRDDFLDAAIRIVDAEGLEALTLRRLGPEVGVSYTAVYTYFKTREDLIAALVDRISEEIIAGVALSGDSARDQLIAIVMSSRRALARHPRLATVYVSDQSDAVAGTQATLSVTAYRVIENYVFGSTIFDFGAAPNHLAIRRRRYRATSHPEFKSVGISDKAVGQHNDEAFEKGLALILDGLGI